MAMTNPNSFDARDDLVVGDRRYTIFNLKRAEAAGLCGISRLPYCLQVLLENGLRHEDGETIGRDSIEAFAAWAAKGTNPAEVGFFPTRIMLHDVSGIPLLADLAAMREHVREQDGPCFFFKKKLIRETHGVIILFI